ncbi:hypothetical protein Sste5346_009168 [Sporothrix stenoceras]|uniref:HpcH/HpaI aldolase/citrate lyase domain-containing protein n=1 Tax=Sporothrix stenoceras TaxID=5173 RepID=A0ABR3YL90_9PEZI
MYQSVAAIAAAGASPIVRVPWAESWLIKRALDSGAHGIMVPMVETKEQADLVARASHYTSTEYPDGVRGCGGAFAPANLGLGAAAYHRQANDYIFVIVQIESQLGVTNAAEIASVPGIDGLFIGPADLASSMGYFPYDFASIPAVLDAAESVRVAAKTGGKAAGHFCMNATDVLKKAEAGWDFMNCGADIVALGTWMGTEIAQVRASAPKSKDEGKTE